MHTHLPLAVGPKLLATPLITRLNKPLAALMMIIIIGATTLIWPVTYLGFGFTFVTQEIFYIEPGGPADKAGLRVGDHILMLYGRPIQEVVASVNVIDLIGSPDRPIPIVVQRAEQVITATLKQEPPPLWFQANKLAMCASALMCWITGYHLGVVRRHEVPGTAVVAAFWLCVGGLMGSLLWAVYTAFPIFLGQLWLIVTFLAPLAVYIHVWFPPRPLGGETSPSQVRLYFLGTSTILNVVMLVWVALSGRSFLGFADILFRVTQVAVISSLAATGWLLVQAYRKATIEHTRRQIRLIAIACLSVTLLWALLAGLSEIIFGYTAVPPQLLTLSFGMVPLAYLLGVRFDGLYRLDRLAIRFVGHLLTATVVGLLLAIIRNVLGLEGTTVIIWFPVALVVFHPWLQKIGLRLLPKLFKTEGLWALDQAIQALNTTLDGGLLVTIVVEGVRAQFAQPALAFFRADIYGTNTLSLYHQERMEDLPATLRAGTLTEEVRQARSVSESRDIQRALMSTALCEDEQRLLVHPKIALWCPIRHPQGHLLGLLVLVCGAKWQGKCRRCRI